ncbi:MAG TPA: Trp family transcriptional regulator [Candidatus Paceibacterota bacterium]|nr:Trp family transcriptional regulator [Candidatus Paceibacterota bacterium]
MKRKPSDLSPEDQRYTRSLLMHAAQEAAQQGTLEDFLEGLFTPSEQIMFGRRIWIARLLMQKQSYDYIGERLFVSTQTIRKIENWLQGIMPKYNEIIEEEISREKIKRRREAIRANPFGLTALKHKYPLHFLLFPWPK